LRASGDLIVSGPTHTNLLDLYLVLRSGAPMTRTAGARSMSELV
jgi:hypothetical protein